MARQRYSDLVDRIPETHHLECPRCHHHNIVPRGESEYVCLNCGWYRDVDHGWGDGPPPFFILIALITLIMVLTLGS